MWLLERQMTPGGKVNEEKGKNGGPGKKEMKRKIRRKYKVPLNNRGNIMVKQINKRKIKRKRNKIMNDEGKYEKGYQK